jgi:acyl carrier protein
VPRSYMAVEPRVRRLLATHLGLDPRALRSETDVPLDAGARLDVVQALERTFSVALNDVELARVRSCRDLAMLIARRVAERDRRASDPPPAPIWVRVIPADPTCTPLERLVELTPYMVETIVEDARGPGKCCRLELILGPAASRRVVEQVERLFAPARAAGLSVEVHRGTGADAAGIAWAARWRRLRSRR